MDNNQTNQKSTSREEYEMKRQGKEKEAESAKRKRVGKRAFLWLSVIVLLILVIFGFAKLASRPSSSQPTLLLNAVSSSDWVEGNKDSKVILVEYGDFQCPACAAYHPLVKQLFDQNKDKMQFVFRNFPLQQHANAKSAAYAAGAAGLQGKFWEMFDKIYPNQAEWSESSDAKNIFMKYATSIGLNIDKFKSDVASKVVTDKVNADYQSGVDSGVNATPTFFLNGRKIQPASYQEFQTFIDQATNGK